MNGEEDQSREYLRQHPSEELALWMDWVQVVCKHRSMSLPTGREWDALTKMWHHGKMPLTSADELETMRNTPTGPLERAEWAKYLPAGGV